jgi:uncharacterized protein (DUF2267 family)
MFAAMPMPWTYRHAGREWAAFLADVRDHLGTPSDNVAYTGTEGVFRAFRDRLTVEQGLGFAQCLPAVPRALFVQGWRPAAPKPWADAATYVAEARALRRDHNFAGDAVLEAVSFALHRAVGPDALRRALADIGPEAESFWRLDNVPEAELRPGFR